MADISIDNITNSTTVSDSVSDGTGTFDKLMNSVNLYLEDQYSNNRLKGTDYANVMLGSIQAVLQQAVQFELQEQLTEAQITIAQKDLELKEIEANRAKDLTEAELEKQWGYDVTRDVEGNLVLGASTDAGKIDTEIDVAKRQIAVTEEQVKLSKAPSLLGR